jgi:homoserine O-acetyltransferase
MLSASLEGDQGSCIVLPSETDLYFRPADNALEIAHPAEAELLPIPRIWVIADNPAANPRDAAFPKKSCPTLARVDLASRARGPSKVT